jgi:hypothetical protein
MNLLSQKALAETESVVMAQRIQMESIFKEEAADYTSSTIRRKEDLLESQKRAFHDTNNR